MTLLALAIACAAPALLRSTVFDARHALASLLFVSWRNPALVSAGANEVLMPVIVPGWTINFEMIFYLLFALTLWAAKPARLAILALLLSGLYLASRLEDRDAPWSFYHNDILFDFLAGSMLGAARIERRPTPGVMSLALAIVGFAALTGMEIVHAVPSSRIVLFGIPSTLILIGALRAEARGAVPRWPLLGALGNASFSTYLTHGFVLAGLRVVTVRLGLGSDAPAFQIMFVLSALIVSAGAGLATFQLVERPLVRIAGRVGRSLRSHSRTAAATASSCEEKRKIPPKRVRNGRHPVCPKTSTYQPDPGVLDAGAPSP